MQLAGDAAALGQRGRGGLALARVLELGHQQLGAVLALAAAPDELARHRQQQAHQRRGDGRLDRRVLRQADGHGERGRDRSRPRRRPERAGAGPRRSRLPSGAASSTGPCGCQAASATPAPPISPITTACAASPRRAQPGVTAVATAAAYTASAQCHAQAGAPQTRRGMGLHAGRHHDRDERPAQRPQRLPGSVTALAGPGSRLRHPGRTGLPPPRRRQEPARAVRCHD